MAGDRVTKRLVVSGGVQGVGYREWTIEQARALDIAGWVRNRRDGSVEILAAGEEAAISELARRCEQGPAAARVDQVAAVEASDQVMSGFEWRPTA